MSNIHLKVKFHEGGFFSNFNKVVTFLSQTKDTVTEITWDLKGQPYGAFAYNCGEVFSKIFDKYIKLEGQKVIELETYTDMKYTSKNIHESYISEDQSWRVSLNNTLQYFLPNKLLKQKQQNIDKQFENKRIISILKRNELLRCEQINNSLPTLDDYFSEIDKIIDVNTYLYLCVDNINDLNEFIKRYKKCIYNPKMRRTSFNTDTEPHFTPGNEQDILYTYLDVYSMSRSEYIIHPLSNMATAALYHNPKIKSIYI